MQLRNRNHILNQHQCIHPHFQVTLRPNQKFENLQNILQKSTHFRTTIPNNRIKLKSILTRTIPTRIFLRLNRLHQNRPNFSSMQFRNTSKPRFLSKKTQSLPRSHLRNLKDPPCRLDIDEDLEGYMQEVFSWLLQSSEEGIGYFEDSCQTLLAFLEYRFVACEGSSDTVLMLVQTLTSQEHIREDIEQSDGIFC